MDLIALTLSLVLLPPIPPPPTLIVLDGAGDYGGCSHAVEQAFAPGDGPAVSIQRFPWSHGYRRVRADQTDREHARAHAHELAQLVLTLSRDRPVFLIAHSAGCAVALYTAELLPPATLERIIMLAPSVSRCYDLTPALASTRCGIDVFVSHRDIIALGVIVRIIGTTDRRRFAPIAGRRGFHPTAVGQDGPAVRNHFWTPELRTLGHDGSHFGAYAPEHLRRAVFPLLHPE